MNYFWDYKYKEFIFTIYTDENAVLGISFGKTKYLNAEYKNTDLIQNTTKQLDEYFSGKRREFTIPYEINGTLFQKKVYETLTNIPYGKLISYKDLAILTGNSNAARAIGSALKNNPIAIIIPCHRVIGSNGDLTGFAGGLKLKKKLIELEQKY